MKDGKNVGKAKKKKKKKWFKKWLLIPIIIIVTIGFFIFNCNYKKTVNLFKEVELLHEEKESFVIILTDSDSQVARNEERNIEEIRKEAHKGLKVFFVDSVNRKTKELDYFIDTYKIISLPSVIVYNSQGDSFYIFMAPLDVKKIIDAMNALFIKNSDGSEE